MKKNIILIALSITLGIAFTFFILNKENTYAKEDYLIYAFQAGAYENIDNAKKYIEQVPSGIIVEEDGLYKIYVAMYKDIDIINKMVVYFEDNGINVYLKNLHVDNDFYIKINNYEKLIKKSEEDKVYNQVNQSILNSYKESMTI